MNGGMITKEIMGRKGNDFYNKNLGKEWDINR